MCTEQNNCIFSIRWLKFREFVIAQQYHGWQYRNHNYSNFGRWSFHRRQKFFSLCIILPIRPSWLGAKNREDIVARKQAACYVPELSRHKLVPFEIDFFPHSFEPLRKDICFENFVKNLQKSWRFSLGCQFSCHHLSIYDLWTCSAVKLGHFVAE